MPTITVNSGKFKSLAFPSHESAEAYDAQAGKVGACVEDADRSTLYRSTLPTFHSKLIPVIKALTGLEPRENVKATEAAQARAKEGTTVNPVLENFVPFTNWVAGQVEADIWSQIEVKAKDLAAETPIDASPTSRSGSGVPKFARDKAEEVLSRDADAVELAVEKLLSKVPGFSLAYDDETGLPESDSLAALVAEFYRQEI